MTTNLTTLAGIDTSQVSGYTDTDTYFAVKTRQGGRDVYTVHLTLAAAPRVLPVPDPNRPTPGNRKVNDQHARDFAKYLKTRADWVAPPLLVRDSGECKFTSQATLPDGSEVGILAVPRGSRTALKIVDGQHRILGDHYALADVETGIEEALAEIDRAGGSASEELQTKLEGLQDVRNRLHGDFLTVSIYVESKVQSYEQMFFDVADHALGINQAVKVRFDNSKIVNRTLYEVLKHNLLKDRVDMEQDRITGSNPNWLGAKHVADLTRSVNIGVVGRVTTRREAAMKESSLVENTNSFFDALVEACPVLTQLADGELTAPELRGRSLLGSVTMLRALAGAYYNLVVDPDGAGLNSDEIEDYFSDLAPHLSAPVTADSVWFKDEQTKGVFTVGAMGPQARAQNLKALTSALTRWGSDGVPASE